jgi:ribosomal protein L31
MDDLILNKNIIKKSSMFYLADNDTLTHPFWNADNIKLAITNEDTQMSKFKKKYTTL